MFIATLHAIHTEPGIFVCPLSSMLIYNMTDNALCPMLEISFTLSNRTLNPEESVAVAVAR